MKKEIEKTKKDITNQKNSAILNEISTNLNEIKDVGIIIYLFKNDSAPVNYIRTEPLASSKEKNFDVVLYGLKNLILISVKESVQGGNIVRGISSLKEYSKDVIENINITDKNKGVKRRVLDYFKEIVGGEIDNLDFVLATQRPSITEIHSKAKELDYDFCLWNIIEKQNRVFINEERINGKEDDFCGHKLKELRDYLDNLSKEGRLYNDILTFMYTSSKYLKATKMSIPLSRKIFDYENWKIIFEVDLYGWHSFEKEIAYKNYVNYGLECNFIKLVRDNGDILKNEYKISSICTKASLLEKDIIRKILKREIKELLGEKVPSIKISLKGKFLSQQAKDRGESLTKYM